MNITQVLLGLIFILGFVVVTIVWPYIRTHVSAE
jgi:flagellar biogenesis protein FliO